MSKLIKVNKPFEFSQNTLTVDEFAPGDKPVEVTDLCATYALKNKFATEVKPKGEGQKEKPAGTKKPKGEKKE